MTGIQREMRLIDEILDGYQFERYVALLLECSGCTKVDITPEKGDFGVDILAWKREQKNAVQCKKYSRPVGEKAVQEVYSGKDYYGCESAWVITNNSFTADARKLAATLGVNLIDRSGLKQMIEQVEKQESCIPSQIEKRMGIIPGRTEKSLLRAAERIIVAEGVVSPLVLQKKLKLSPQETTQLLEDMQQSGILSAPDKNQVRKLLHCSEEHSDKK